MAHLIKSLIVLLGITTSVLAQATAPAAPKNLRLKSNLATPTLVQHVATGMDRNPLGTLNITLPNPVRAGNCLILGVQYNSALSSSVTSVNDNLGNIWAAGPKSSNASFQNQNLFYALNAKAGITSITITISNLSSQESSAQAVFSEFYNVALISAADGSSSNSASASPGAITTASAGDLIYHWGINGSAINTNGGNYNSTTPIVAGSNFSLLSADLQVGSCDQYWVQPSAGSTGAISFTYSGGDTWQSVAIALKSQSAGTPPPSGIYIAHVQHTLISSRPQSRTTVSIMQFPSMGNLLVGSFDSGSVTVNSMSDSAGNSWRSAALNLGPGSPPPGAVISQMLYAQNATTSNTLHGITVKESGPTTADEILVLYDVVNAAASAFDVAASNQGTQNVAGNVQLLSITPTTSNGLVFCGDSHDYGSNTGLTGTGYIFDCAWNNLNHNTNPGTPTSTMDEDNCKGHFFNPTAGVVTFNTAHNLPSDVVGRWSAVAAAFKGGGP
jgi:hypothetical protein